MAGASGGIVYQGAPYEGLTCDFLELLFAAGGTVLSEDGTKATIDSPQSVKALQFMVDGIKNGDAPKAVTTYMEPESLAAFQTGKYAFMRNWPYAYALNKEGREGQGQVRRHAVPGLRGRRQGRASSVATTASISAYSKNPGGALKLIDFIGSAETQTRVRRRVQPDAGARRRCTTTQP